MYTGFQHLHSFLAYLFLAVMLAAVIHYIIALSKKKDFGTASGLLAVTGMSLAHLQLVIGIVLYFLSPLGFANFGADAMGESLQRLYIVEHPLINIIGIVLITIGYSLAKRSATAVQKHKKLLIFYGIGTFLILLRIPWQVWP
ncbi:MAG: hypothetical protein EA411_09845 [Saprospirales bacterium]|nr:MAG: hypothetical protein EA411_09845 [Saprospirales bacterium]